jgi:hypothetical protein
LRAGSQQFVAEDIFLYYSGEFFFVVFVLQIVGDEVVV